MINQNTIMLNLLRLAGCGENKQMFSNIVKVDRAAISKYVNGKRAISLEVFLIFCQKAGVDPKDCF